MRVYVEYILEVVTVRTGICSLPATQHKSITEIIFTVTAHYYNH